MSAPPFQRHDIIQRQMTEKRYKIQLFFHHRVAKPLLVFLYQMSWQYSDGNPRPLTGASNAGGVSTNRDRRDIAGY